MEIINGAIYVNRKTGNLYTVLKNNVVNATNANDGQRMVEYIAYADPIVAGKTFVREFDEFCDKFDRLYCIVEVTEKSLWRGLVDRWRWALKNG